MISRARFSFRPRLRFCPARESGPSDCWLSRKNSIAGCCSTAFSMSPNRPSTCGLIASRSNDPAHIRASPPLLAEMQKWLDQNTTRRSTKPQSAMTARCSRARASARKVFWMMLSGCGGGFGGLGCIASAGAIAALPLVFAGACIAGSLADSLAGSRAVISLAMLESERLRRCALASGGGCGGASLAAPGAAAVAALRACCVSN